MSQEGSVRAPKPLGTLAILLSIRRHMTIGSLLISSIVLAVILGSSVSRAAPRLQETRKESIPYSGPFPKKDTLDWTKFGGLNPGWGQYEATPAATETFVNVSVVDQSGQPVYIELTQGDMDGDIARDSIASICGSSDKPVRVQPNFALRIIVYEGACPDGTQSVPTRGTLEITYFSSFRTPPKEPIARKSYLTQLGCDEPGKPINYARTSQPGPHKMHPGESLTIPSAAGGKGIRIGLVRPAVPAGTKVPVIAWASPYFLGLMASGNESALQTYDSCYLSQYVAHGYAVAYIAVRGTGGSGGCMDLMGDEERSDFDDALTWLGTREWSNGNIGMIGISYDGITQWEAAATGNPHLKTIVPMSAVNDLFHLLHDRGVNEQRTIGILTAGYWGQLSVLGNDNLPESVLCPEMATSPASDTESTVTGERDHFGYYAERNLRPLVEKNYRGSILLARGLNDINIDADEDFPWVSQLEDKTGIYVKYVLGQWGHDRPDDNRRWRANRFDWADLLLDWWEYWLKGDKSASIGPRTEVQDSSERWRSDNTSWPPPDVRPAKFFFTSEGLAPDPATATISKTVVPEGTYWPTDAMRGTPDQAPCDNCVVLTSPPLQRAMRYAGIPTVDVTVIPKGPGGFLSAFLYAEDKNGELERLDWGGTDFKFPEDQSDKAQTVTPNEELHLQIDLEPADVVVSRGKRLVLVLNQTSYSVFLPSTTSFPTDVLIGGKDSLLTLPQIRRPNPRFFIPPPAPPGREECNCS